MPFDRRTFLEVDGLSALAAGVPACTRVLGWACSSPAQASWVVDRCLDRQHPLVHQNVLPVVTEVVRVHRGKSVPWARHVAALGSWPSLHSPFRGCASPRQQDAFIGQFEHPQ
jgi:hypothetical protein